MERADSQKWLSHINAIRSGGLLLGLVLRRGWLGIGRRLGLRLLRRGSRWRLATRGRRRFLRRGGLGGGDRLLCRRLGLGLLASLGLLRIGRRLGPLRRLLRRTICARRRLSRLALLVRRFRGGALGSPLPTC